MGRFLDKHSVPLQRSRPVPRGGRRVCRAVSESQSSCSLDASSRKRCPFSSRAVSTNSSREENPKPRGFGLGFLGTDAAAWGPARRDASVSCAQEKGVAAWGRSPPAGVGTGRNPETPVERGRAGATPGNPLGRTPERNSVDRGAGPQVGGKGVWHCKNLVTGATRNAARKRLARLSTGHWSVSRGGWLVGTAGAGSPRGTPRQNGCSGKHHLQQNQGRPGAYPRARPASPINRIGPGHASTGLEAAAWRRGPQKRYEEVDEIGRAHV